MRKLVGCTGTGDKLEGIGQGRQQEPGFSKRKKVRTWKSGLRFLRAYKAVFFFYCCCVSGFGSCCPASVQSKQNLTRTCFGGRGSRGGYEKMLFLRPVPPPRSSVSKGSESFPASFPLALSVFHITAIYIYYFLFNLLANPLFCLLCPRMFVPRSFFRSSVSQDTLPKDSLAPSQIWLVGTAKFAEAPLVRYPPPRCCQAKGWKSSDGRACPRSL